MFEILQWLWDAVTAPALHHLRRTRTPEPGQAWPHVWWIPTGPLTVPPLHAAGHHHDPPGPTRRVVLDRVVSSYTPTVRALYQAGQHTRRDRPALIVGVNQTQAADAAPLSLAEQEARDIHRVLQPDTAPLLGADATHDTVVTALRTAGWAHLACHARVDPDDPAESHLALHDRPLSVRQLGSLDQPGAYLAYLSACTTATGSPRLLDEAIHIAAAFQLAGFTHTVATLWPVPDRVALRFAHHVYRDLHDRVDPALAVHKGVQHLRARYPQHPYAWASHIHLGP